MTTGDKEPALAEQTVELGSVLRLLMETDPTGTPTESAAVVFGEWLSVAGPASKKPEYFADVASNYTVRENSNRDLFDLFVMLEAYLAESVEPEPMHMGAFIGLPVLGE